MIFLGKNSTEQELHSALKKAVDEFDNIPLSQKDKGELWQSALKVIRIARRLTLQKVNDGN